MQVSLAYGRGRLPLTVPDTTIVLTPEELPGLPDEQSAFETAVRRPIAAPPLRELATCDSTVAIVIADITRPSPSERLVAVDFSRAGAGAAAQRCDPQRHRLAPRQHARRADRHARPRDRRQRAHRQP